MGKSRGRASSSGLAASLLPEAQGAVPVVGFGGYHGASRVEPAAASSATDPDGSVRLPPDVDAEVLQHLRRLGRKDPTTKLKALSTLSMLFAQKPGEEVVQIVPQWAFEYKRLLLDYNRDVRRATNDTMASLVSAVKKGLAPHLKSLMGPWWFSQFDPATEVAQAGRRSFEAAFPQSDRRMDALMLCVKETFLYLNENLKLTTQALSDKVTPMDELEDMHERVISSSLLAMATLIDILLGVKLQSDGGDSMNTESKSHSKVRFATLSSAEAALSMHKYFIDFLRSKSAVIRSATYTLLTSYVKYVPNVFNEEAMKILSSTLLGAFSEKDPLCHSAMWDAVLVFSRRFPEAWSYCNIQKVVLNRFWQFLQNGCYGSKQASYPLIVQFLDSIPPKEVATEQFAFEFLKHLWAGRNQRQLSAADSLAFFTAFKQSFLWFLKNAPRNSVGDSSDYIRNRLITNVLVKMVWQDYLQLSLSKNMDVVPSLLSQEAATDDQQLSHKKSLLAANVRHPIYYYQDLGKCIAEILDDISVTERHLLETACESLLRDYLDIVQQGEKLSKFQDHVNQLVSFFHSLDILVVQNGRTWPLENLARPLVERSLPAIKSMDSPSLVELLLVLVEIFGPAPLFLKSSEINDDKSYVEPYLSLFDADFVPWCLDGKYSTCSSKIDLLLSLIQEECFFDQWCLIIKHTRAKQKQSVDHKISHTKDQFELLTLILQKVRERIAGGKMKNLQRSGSLPEHWRHDLLDSVAVSVFCDLPATDSHVHFLCAALGGSSQDDQICFLSAEAVCKIRGSILKSLASVLITSTFEWTKSSRFLLLPMEHEHSKILGEQSLSANLEIAQLAFQVLERSLFALKTHEEDSVFSHILSALFIIEWECSMALVLAEESDLKGHKEEINVEALMCNTSDDHLDETVHLKANLAERIHAFRQSLIPSFWNDLHSGTLNRLVNILAQSVRYAVFDTVDLPIDRTAVLCSEWVVDMLRLICLDHIKLQSFFDALLSEGEYWPLWVKPSLQNGHASVKIQREPLTTDGTELKHQRFVAFVDKLVLNLSFGEVILAPLSSFSRAWVAAEMICTWNWKGGSAFSTFLPSLVQYMKTEPGLEVSFVSLLLDTLLEGALMHESSDWALFNSWHLSDSEIEKIQDRFLRSLVALLFTAYTKESVLRESDAHVLFEQLRSSLFIGSAVNRKCLRTLPFVMSTIIKPLTEKVRLNEASPCTDLLGKSILSWLEEAISCLSSSPREVAQQDIEDWMQVVLSCFPLKITGGTSKLIVKFEREISDAETSLLLTLFSRYQTFYGSADPSLSSRETILSKTVELLGVKLTAVMVGYCWTKLGETDWCFVFRILRKWIESSVLLVEEMTDNINDAAVNQTSAQDILEKLKLIACTMEDLTFTFAESALVTLCHLNLVDNLHETDNSPNLQLIRSGEYAESNDKMMENILRLFLASGVSEAIAGSCSEEASSIIASSRVDHLHFWELVASFIIDASPQIRRSALDSMKLWGLTKESVSGLYSILFSSEPISHLQFAAYSLLMSEPLCQLSLVKGSSVGEIGEIPSSSQESEMGQNIESIPDSEKALYLRDELTALIEMPTSELVKTDLVALERVNVFVAWALVLSHLQLLPLSSATREKVLQYVQDKISPSILDCIFQHIPLKTAAPSGKKKDVELMPEARAAAEASKGAITTCSLLPYVESLWPVGVLQMASLAGSLYGMMIRLLPSYVRTWFTSLRDRSLSYSIESFTRAWCSPPLLLDEFSQGGGYQSTADETPVNCDSAWQNNSPSYESTLFHGIEEGGIHALAYSSHEIDEHENERASHLSIILELVVNDIKKLREKLRPTDLINVYYMIVDFDDLDSSRFEKFLQSKAEYIRNMLGTTLVPRAMAPSDMVFISVTSHRIHDMSIVMFYEKCIPELPFDLVPHLPGNMETSLNQSEVDILCKSFPEEIVATTHWEPGSILIYEATMHGGFTMPLNPFIASIVNAFGISPAQLLKHGWLAIQTFLTQCDEKQLKPSVDSFLYFFSIFKSPHKYDDRDHYSFKTLKPDIMKVSKAKKIRTGRHEKMEWHKRFFFIKSKSNEGWLFPEKWARGGPLSKKCQLTEDDQEVVKALGGNPTADECLSPVSAPSPALGSSLPKEVDDQEVSKALGGNPSADHCLPPVPALPAALASSLPKEQRIEKSVECSRTMQNIELQKRIDNLEQVLEKQAIQMKNICQQHENDKKRWETESKNTFATIEALVAECEGLKIKYNEEMAEKKKLHNIVQELKGNIRVFCRCRPLSKLEASLGFKTAVDFDGADDGELRIIEGKSRRLFKFDRVYAPDDDQAKVFSDASSLVTSVLDGYNVCILAYGQTGTGKTFTMEGTEQNRGVNYRTLRELFSLTDNKKQLFQYNIYVSMLEVYNENIRDLLSPSMASPTKLEIKTASDGSHYIRGIAEREVDNIDDAWDILLSGSNSRAVGSTDVNEHSSRSHSMLCITVSANNLINNVCTKSKLWLVDLAGSERNAKTGAQGDRLEEAKNINRSLSALGNVIAALASGHSHIPYRDSKLTYLLQDFLGGDSKALLLVQISPSDNDLAETIDTLKFAERAMGVELGPAKRQKGYLAVRGGGVHEAGLGAAATPGADAGRHASAAGRHHGPLSEAFHRRRQGLAAAGCMPMVDSRRSMQDAKAPFMHV